MQWIVGIDEVGRGALAGPVVVAAAAMPGGLRFPPRATRAYGALKDSKKLTAKKREAWNRYFKKHPKILWSVARIYPQKIDQWNVSKAANMAALRAYERLERKINVNGRSRVFLDGGLFLGNHRRFQKAARPKNVKTIIKGDEKIGAVKIASIIAKVHRDRYMVRLAKQHPHYGFEIHKGYGTSVHRAALKRHGPSSVHRLTFVS